MRSQLRLCSLCGGQGKFWRTEGDSNPRYACDVYTLSRRAPSTARPPVRDELSDAAQQQRHHRKNQPTILAFSRYRKFRLSALPIDRGASGDRRQHVAFRVGVSWGLHVATRLHHVATQHQVGNHSSITWRSKLRCLLVRRSQFRLEQSRRLPRARSPR